MRFDWREFSTLADELAGREVDRPASDNARQRTAISRTYYAAFHACRLRAGTKMPAYVNSHLAIVEFFRHNQSRAYKEIGTRLNRLLLDRRAADYDEEVPNLPWLTEKALANAREILRLIDAL